MVRDEDNLVLSDTYHSEGEGNNGVTPCAHNATRSETGGIIGQVASIGAGQTHKDGEGENVFHFESI